MAHLFHQARLKTALLLVIIASITIITIVSTGVQLYLDYQKKISNVEANLQFISDSYLSTISDRLWDFDESNVRLQLQGILKLTGLTYCFITDDEGIIGSPIEEGDPDATRDIVKQYPLTHREKLIGKLTVAANFDHIDEALVRTSVVILTSYGCVALVFTIFMLIISNQILFRHFKAIANYTKKLGIDNLQEPLSLERPARSDELQLIVNALNDMRIRIQDGLEEKQKMQVQLEYNHNVLTALQESSWEGILVVDQDGRIVTRNQRFNEIWQIHENMRTTVSDNQLIEHVLDRLIDPEGFQSRIKYLYDQKEERSKDTLHLRDGTIIERRSGPVYGKDKMYFGRVWYFRDITKQMSTEKSLRESEDKYRYLFNMESDAIFLVDNASGKITEANDAALKIYGYTKGEMLQLKKIDLSAEPDKTRRSTVRKETAIPIRYHRKKDGTEFPVEITVTHFTWKGRDVLIAAVRDISFRLEHEKEKREMDLRLQQAQKMESIGNLAGGIAHDFNNILVPIVGLSEMLLEDLPQGSLEHENVEEIFKAGKRGRDLVKQILAFSRQSDNILAPVRVQHIVEEALKLSRATIPSNIDITYHIQPDCGLVKADSTQVHQIVINLITNAYHAVESNGGSISIELREATVVEDTRVEESLIPGRYVVLTVTDKGYGISQDSLDKIFEPYYTTKDKEKGTGLGLATVYGIMKAHGGDISVHSHPGKGSTFKVYFPLMRGMTDTRRPSQVSDHQGGNENILLVDDEPAVVSIVKKMLEKLGYTVTALTNSIDALKTFRTTPESFDLVISDMTMPNMTGDHLSKEIVSTKPEVPIIICTGFSEKMNKERAAAIGVRGFLMKPVVIAEMATMVRSVLDGTKITN